MLPLVAIAGVIGAIPSVVKGVHWLADQVNSTKSADPASTGTDSKPAADKASPFATAMAAQSAGQTLPTAPAISTQSVPALDLLPVGKSANLDELARLRAGLAAYGALGEHHGQPSGSTAPGAGDDVSQRQSTSVASL